MKEVLYEDDDQRLYEENGDYYYESKATDRVEVLSSESMKMHLRYFSA